jgi:hypothetical protein
MRGLVGIAIGALALAAVGTALAGSSATTSVRVTYWADRAQPDASVVWTLRCAPPGGSLRRPARACERIASGSSKLFAPLPRGTACTQIYGGPQKARIVGTVLGTRIWATFTRSDGCQIGRWQRLSPWLLPAGGVP